MTGGMYLAVVRGGAITEQTACRSCNLLPSSEVGFSRVAVRVCSHLPLVVEIVPVPHVLKIKESYALLLMVREFSCLQFFYFLLLAPQEVFKTTSLWLNSEQLLVSTENYCR